MLNVLDMLKVLLFGWPIYLLINSWGPKGHEGASHFYPKSVLFKPQQYSQIVWSDIGVLTTLTIVGACIYNFGFITVGKYYLVPYLV